MEILIPLVGLGGIYLISKQNEKNEGYKNIELPCSFSDFIAVYNIGNSGDFSFNNIINHLYIT